MSKELINKVQKIIQEELRLSSLPDAEACQKNITEWDSLAYMSIVARIEKEFGIEATRENIQCFSSINEIVQRIKESKSS